MKSNITSQPKLENAFVEFDKQERIRLYKYACWFVFFGMPGGILLDLNIYPGYALSFLKLRLISAFLALVLLGLFYTQIGLRHYRILFPLLPLMCQGFISWMIYATEGAVSPYYAGLNLIMLTFFLLFPWTYLETLGITIATFVFYMIACFAHGPVHIGGIFFNNVYFLFLTAVFAIFGTYFTSRLRTREFALRFELDQNKRILEEANQKLVDLDQMKSRFFANISHELRTPLTLLIAPLESLQQQKADWMDEETKTILQTMYANAMRLLKLINDLLDLVKLESGRIEVKKESVEIGLFLKGLAQSVSGVAKDKRVQLTVSAPSDLESLWVDRDKLEKIILNLVFNALKFTAAGGKVELKAECLDKMLTVRIADNGMGISEQQLPYIFDRFWQADSASNRKYQGTGIGLALVKELVELQGGDVKAVSQIGAGTTMTVRIPADPAGEALSAPGEEKSTGVVPELSGKKSNDEWITRLYRRAELFPTMTALSDTLRPESYNQGRKPKILVADDEPDVLNFLKSQLSKNYEVLEAVDGNQAMEKIRQFLPEVAILDMMMPEKDGIEVCFEIKTNLMTQSIPVILLTARADDETKLAALNAGASDFLTKPFSTTELHTRIKNLVDSHHFQSELSSQNKKLEAAMEQLKDTEATLVQTEKMSSLGRLSAGMIHEINNPLNYALAAVSLLKTMREKWPENDRAKFDDLLFDMHEGMTRVQTIVSDLRSFTHPHGRSAELIELDEVISIALRFLGHEIEKDIQIKIEVLKDQKVFAEKNSLTHVFINLFQNAVDALKVKKTGREKPALLVRSEVDGEKVRVWVRDNGTGIPSDYLDKIFDPFFTTKDVGEGMGLGLSICYRIMAEQGGNISVKSEAGQFTEFLLELRLK